MIESSLTIIVTVISGVIVFVFTELFKEMVIEPLRKYREIKCKIAKNLIFYANFYSNPLDINKIEKDNPLYQKYVDASNEIRILAAELGGYIETISWFHPGVPRKEKLSSAYAELIGLSNSFFLTSSETDIYTRNINHVNAVRKKVGLYTRK